MPTHGGMRVRIHVPPVRLRNRMTDGGFVSYGYMSCPMPAYEYQDGWHDQVSPVNRILSSRYETPSQAPPPTTRSVT